MDKYSTAVVSQALIFLGYDTVSVRRFLLHSMTQDRITAVEDAIAAGFDVNRTIELAELTKDINNLENPNG